MRLGRFITWRRVRRGLLAVMLLGVVTLTAGTITFLIVAHGAQRDFRPVREELSPELKTQIDKYPKYRRAEESTYLTFPEWYLVFNPQELAELLAQHAPSSFPYFRSIRQYWGGYAQVYAITRRHYPFNFGNHLMVVVIGVSSTGEWLVKGAYEKTVGRLFEWMGGFDTPEDRYAATVAHDYGQFIPTRPWFEFPFGQALGGLWSKTDFFGPHFLRKCERKFFLSVEYGVKCVYAAAMRAGSHAVYGVADTEIFASMRAMPDGAFAVPGLKKIQPTADGGWIVTLPHYQGFTDTAPVLAKLGAEFGEVAGNGEILLTLLAPAAWNYDLPAGRALFTMPLLTGDARKRVAVQAPAKSLGEILRQIDARGLKLEHLFD